MANPTLEEQIASLKKMAERLIPHTYPLVDFAEEQKIAVFKQHQMNIDGYGLLACYSKADYKTHYLESVQVQSAYAPFMPFNLVCKVGRAFLGSINLQFIDFLRNNRKVYCWTLKTKDGKSLVSDPKNEQKNYEGFEYTMLEPGVIDLF